MKKITLLLVSLLTGLMIQAQVQYTFNICGFVSSVNSNTPAINATISGYITQSNGTTIGQFSSNTDSTGNYCSTAFSASPDTANCAFLSITVTASVPGCNVTQTYTLNEWLCSDTTVIFNINGCDTTNSGCTLSTTLYEDSTPCMGPLPGLSVGVWGGTTPYSYVWSTNETTQFICNLNPGQYCVTVTDANGCVSSSCYYLGSNTNICSV